MKIHDHLVEKITKSWKEIFFEHHYADKVIEKRLKLQKKWGSRDRRFFAESVYDGVRWWRKLWELLDEEPSDDPDALTRLWAVLALEQGVLANPDRWGLDMQVVHRRKLWLEKQASRAVYESIPDWLDEYVNEQIGPEWPNILSALNEKAPVDLRTNTLKISRESLQKILQGQEIETNLVELAKSALTLQIRKNVFATEAFQKGLFEVQDRSSQLVAQLLDPQSGERVIDACAGAGGKSLHIAALMKNKGRILALDIHSWKLEALRERSRRAGVDIIETREITSSKVIKRLEENADRVLLDVPCSGLGVLRRNPDTKWKLTLAEIENLKKTQEQILQSYSRMVKPGGVLVYSTCSILPEENHKQVENFLKNNKDHWTLVKEQTIFPGQGRGDGFYMARMQKT